LLSGRTSFVIAHRLSTIRNADQILVLKAGSDHRTRQAHRTARKERLLLRPVYEPVQKQEEQMPLILAIMKSKHLVKSHWCF
jgi:ABC-type transport system involved in cytochrome bd biosynthesis fused ATPase/permease subunit